MCPGEYSGRMIKVIIEIIFVVFFILLGIIFSLGKGYFLIAGFNTMPIRDFVLGILLGAIWLGITIFILRYLGVIQFDSKNDVNYMWV